MKLIISLTVILACFALSEVICGELPGLTDDMRQLMKMLHDQCRDESGVAEEVLKKAQDGSVDESDEKLQCYMKCIFAQVSAMDDDGNFDPEVAIAAMTPEMAERMGPTIRACKDTTGANACEKALRINQCLYQKAPQDYFLI